ncbi:hypothetical protein ACIA5G_47890 [Amycolatopsis sp. NPDC051758]|uniref:hypothetical protein n=1 Tax=Amycolatopsis sp. NPDC051758 TaxID=3363935 RepID=UPI0037924F39
MAVARDNLPVPNNTPMGGYGWSTDRRADGSVANPLRVRCAIIVSPQGQRVVFLQADVISIPRPVYERILAELMESGVVSAPENFVLAQSHTHAGPMVGAKPDPYVLLGSTGAAETTEQYTDDVFVPFLVSVAEHAHALPLVEVTLGYAEGFAEIGLNRRRLAWTPREVPVLVARRADNRDLFAVLAGHACHPVCATWMSRTLDADYCGYAMDEVEKRLGETNVPVIFFQGAAGDINPNDPPDGVNKTALAAERLVAAIIATVRNAAYFPIHGPITTDIRTVDLNYAVDLDDEDELSELTLKYRARANGSPGEENGTGYRHAKQMLAELDAGDVVNHMPMTIQKIDLGGLTILTMSHEVLSGWHVGTKAKWAAKNATPLWVMGYANHIDCYVPAFDVLSAGDGDDPNYGEAGWKNGDPKMIGPGTFGHSYSLIAPLNAGSSPQDPSGVEGTLVPHIDGLLGLA